jgi:short-subunit dehydrogenase
MKELVIVITGASSGIGSATAKFLKSKGHSVYGLSRSLGDVDGVNYISTDITDRNAVDSALQKIKAEAGRIDVLINNAGMGVSGAIEYATAADYDKIFNLNVKALITLCQLAIPYLRETKGKIINIGSVAGVLTIPFQAYYSMTKAAVGVFSEALRMELKPFKISVTTVQPGDTKTSFTTNREKPTIVEDGLYKKRIINSLERMEKDEQSGVPPVKVSKVIYRVIKKKNPPISVTVGFNYKLFVFLKRLLPNRFINYILYLMYGK